MRQLLITITLVLTVMFSEFAKATTVPDFSGTWVLNAAKSTLPKDSTIKSQTIVIDNKKSAIVFHYKTDGKKSTETYTPDGGKSGVIIKHRHGLRALLKEVVSGSVEFKAILRAPAGARGVLPNRPSQQGSSGSLLPWEKPLVAAVRVRPPALTR